MCLVLGLLDGVAVRVSVRDGLILGAVAGVQE